MRLLNVGCGGNRPQDEHWWNLDELRKHLKPGTPERINLDKEPRYIEAHLPGDLLLFAGENESSFDGILCSHVIEHLTCHEAVAVLYDCRRILKPGGLLVVSVPDAEYFLKVYDRDTPENAVELFGEPISESWQPNFFSYALFKDDHQMVIGASSLHCLLLKAGFTLGSIVSLDPVRSYYGGGYCNHTLLPMIMEIMNRRKFSLEMAAIKSA